MACPPAGCPAKLAPPGATLRLGDRGRRSVTGEAIAVAGFDDAAGGGHGGEVRVEGGGADAAAGAQLGEGAWPIGVREGRGDAFVDGRRRGLGFRRHVRLDRLEREGIGALGERQGDAGDGGGGAVLGGEHDTVVAVAAKVEVGIAPGMELGGAAQGLAGADGAATLAGVVDDGDGNRVAALQVAQEGEHRRDLAAGVFIDAVQADERIEDEQARLEGGDGLVENVRGRCRDRGAGSAR